MVVIDHTITRLWVVSKCAFRHGTKRGRLCLLGRPHTGTRVEIIAMGYDSYGRCRP